MSLGTGDGSSGVRGCPTWRRGYHRFGGPLSSGDSSRGDAIIGQPFEYDRVQIPGGLAGKGPATVAVKVALEAAADNVSSPTAFTFSQPVAAGTFLSVLVGDGFGYSPTVTAITDSQGNIYSIDSDTNEADGDGSVFVAHSNIATALNAGDDLTIFFTSSPWPHFCVIATAFPGTVTTLDVAGIPHGSYSNYPIGGPQTLDVNVVATAGDLLIAYTCVQRGPIQNDTSNGWTTFLDNRGNSPINVVSAGYQTSAAAHYITTNEDTGAAPPDVGDFGAAVVCAYRP